MASLLKKAVRVIEDQGLSFLFRRIISKLRTPTIPFFGEIAVFFENKSGLEVGGPSAIFEKGGFIPIYPLVKSLDGCNFSAVTLWEGQLSDSSTPSYISEKPGVHFIHEATDLSGISSNCYDFVISSNCLEHVANPLKAVQEWLRVLKPNGIFLLILPDKAFNFDHKRPITAFSHLLQDYHSNVGENDLTHFDEIISLHDLERDKQARSHDEFRVRCLANFEFRGMHHHVFDLSLMQRIAEFSNVSILHTYEGFDYVMVCQKRSS